MFVNSLFFTAKCLGKIIPINIAHVSQNKKRFDFETLNFKKIQMAARLKNLF